MPKMHLNTFGGRALPGPVGELKRCPDLLLLLLLSMKMIKMAQNQETSRTPNNIRQCHSSDRHQ